MSKKKDEELEKIQGLINRIDDLYDFFYSGRLKLYRHENEAKRVRAYIRDRYKWFFEWFNDEE